MKVWVVKNMEWGNVVAVYSNEEAAKAHEEASKLGSADDLVWYQAFEVLNNYEPIGIMRYTFKNFKVVGVERVSYLPDKYGSDFIRFERNGEGTAEARIDPEGRLAIRFVIDLHSALMRSAHIFKENPDFDTMKIVHYQGKLSNVEILRVTKQQVSVSSKWHYSPKEYKTLLEKGTL